MSETAPLPSLELEDRIDHYLKGSLRPEQIDALWVDLIESGSVEFLKTTATVRKIAMEGPKVIPVPIRPRNRVRVLTAAAAATLVIGVGGTMYLAMNQADPVLEPLVRIEYELVRSAVAMETSVEDPYRRAMELAVDGNTQEAIAVLAGATTIQEQLLLGTIHYNTGQFREALAVFEGALHLSDIHPAELEKATWFAGQSALRFGDKENALSLMRQTVELDGAYRRPAQRMVSQLSR